MSLFGGLGHASSVAVSKGVASFVGEAVRVGVTGAAGYAPDLTRLEERIRVPIVDVREASLFGNRTVRIGVTRRVRRGLSFADGPSVDGR